MPVTKKFAAICDLFPNFRYVLICSLCYFSTAVYAQDQDFVAHDSTTENVTDMGDVLARIFKKKPDSTKAKKKQRNLVVLPSIGYNPSFGFIIGAKASAIKQFGNAENTGLSAFGLEGLYTSKGVITAQARHNIFTPGNKVNLQGNWQLSKFLITDYSIGTGNKDYLTNSDSAFLIRFNYVRLTEKMYRKVGPHLFLGGGLNMNIRYKIDDYKLDSLKSTPHYRYSVRNGFSHTRYSANGLLLAIQYNTREHPIRSYKGVYADLSLVINQKWLGSTTSAMQAIYDIRKYLGLSRRNPEHVLAIWHQASYRLDGKLPYLALPATGYDIYNRSGRAYTIGRFKGPSYAYFESEYRFPITRNKLISGVAFMNLQTASDDLEKKLFQYWDPGYGAGLRILFQKQSRSTICIDYAKGKYDSGGFFLRFE